MKTWKSWNSSLSSVVQPGLHQASQHTSDSPCLLRNCSAFGDWVRIFSSKLGHDLVHALKHGFLANRDIRRASPSLLFAILLALSFTSCAGGGGNSPPANQIPVASAGGPYSGNVAQVIAFDGSKSADADGDSLTFSWNFDDGSTGSGAKPTHSYAAAGQFTVSLAVSDGRGGMATASTSASVNAVPTANAGGSYSGVAGQLVQFDGSKSSDVDGDTLTYTWNFGDSSTGTGVKPTHAYSVAGTFTVSLTVDDGRTGTSTASTTATVTVTSPDISDFNPKSGTAGTLINVTGSNLTLPNGTGPQVTLMSQGGGTINAPISAFTATSASFVIPAGAATGAFTISVGGQTATSAVSLTITTSSSFTLSAVPASGNLIQGQSVAYAVSLASTNGFSQLATLNVSGLPAGVTASFSPAQITTGQTSVLTVAAPANQAAGAASLTISGSATVEGIAESQSANVSLNLQLVSTTFLGRTVVDDTQENPITGVTVKFLGVDDKGNITGCAGQARSDAGGNFALTQLPAACTGPQLISYDGSTATFPAGKYAGVDLSYTLTSGQVTTSPVLIHLPRIDNAETVQVQQNASTNQVLTFQTIPGLVVTVYPNTTFSLQDGSQPNPFPLVAIQIPVDRLPDLIPSSGMLTTFIVAFQPANAVASQPVAVNFPNPLDVSPGTTATFMTLDPTHGYMVPYGTGTVSSNGTEFVADPDPAHPGHSYGLVHFDWHGPSPPSGGGPGPGPGGGCVGCCPADAGDGSGAGGGPDGGGGPAPFGSAGPENGQPIDLSSGIAIVRATDLAINGRRGSIMLARVYRTLSNNPGPFGIGTGHNYGYLLNLFGFSQGQGLITMIMPNGNQIPFTLQSNGTFLNAKTPAFRGAVMTNSATGVYSLRRRDGTTFLFQSPANAPRVAYLNSITDANGNAVTLTHGNSSSPDQITQVTDPVGRSLTLVYDSSGRITSVTDTIGRRVTYTYNPQGTLATVTDAAGGVTRYNYDTQNRLTQEIDARGVMIAQNTYDANGRVTQQIQADGGVIKFAYTLLNAMVPTSPVLLTAVTDPVGNTTTYRWDPSGFLLAVTDPTGQMRNFTRDPQHNNLVSAVTGSGSCPICGNTRVGDLKFTYDVSGNLATRTDALGNTTKYVYDPVLSKMTSSTDPLGNVTKYVYDAAGNLMTITDANGHTNSYARNSFGQVTQNTDPLGQKTAYSYDPSGNVASTTDPLGNTTAYTYDGVSRIVQLQDPRGVITTGSYDALDRRTTTNNSQGNTRQVTFDAVGHLLSVTDEQGQTTSFTYDSFGRPVSRTDPRGKTGALTYDLNGNLIKVVDRRGQTSTFAYDSLNRQTSQTYQDGTIVTGAFDSGGRLAHVVDSVGGTFNFTYDLVGELTSSASQLGAVQFSYDAAGRVRSRQVAGQSAVAYAYDTAGNLQSASLPQASANFSYDALNRVLQIGRSNGVSSQHTYDAAGRLTSIMHSGGQGVQIPLTYTYDAADNRTLQTTNAAAPQSLTNSFDSAHRLLQSGTASYAYDDNGNLISAIDSTGTTTYVWDARNRLQSISSSNGQRTTLVYDFAGNLISQADSGPALNLTQNFILDDVSNIAYVGRNNGDSLSVLSGRGIDSHLAVIHSSGQVEYGLADAVNSSVATVDQNGARAASFSYEPYGQTTTTSTYPFQFTGRVPVNGSLYSYRARYCSARVGRFISEDPTGFGGGSTLLYKYAGNSPLVHSDPTGLDIFTSGFKSCMSDCMNRAGGAALAACLIDIGIGIGAAGITAGASLVVGALSCDAAIAGVGVACAAGCSDEPPSPSPSCPGKK